MQLKTKLADVDANRAVLDNAVILSFAEYSVSDAVLAQILSMAVKGSFGEEKQ
jgi:hypothetical protein